MILYGASVYYTSVHRKSIIKKLHQFQRLIAIKIIKGYRTISFDAATVLAGITPLDLKIVEIANLYSIKKLNQDVDEIRANELQKAVRFKLRPHPASVKSIEIHQNLPENDELIIYTDGSKTNQHVGAAFTAQLANKELKWQNYRLSEKCSVFQAELIAIKEATKWLTTSTNYT